jgi:hypothetical protein
MQSTRVCSIDDCDRPMKARGWCKMHWHRWYVYGETCRPAEIPARWQARFWSKVERSEGCWTWTANTNQSGYGMFAHPARGMISAHRVSWEIANGPISDGAHVLHSCDNRTCVNPSHMRLGSHDDNMRDMAERERSRTTKLTASDVSTIRELARTGRSLRSIAREFRISPGNVGFIIAGKTWKHVS